MTWLQTQNELQSSTAYNVDGDLFFPITGSTVQNIKIGVNGTFYGEHNFVNFSEGNNVSLSAIDNFSLCGVDIQINSIGGGGSSITGGILNYVSKFSLPNNIIPSSIFDNGINVGIGVLQPNSQFHITGSISASSITASSSISSITLSSGTTKTSTLVFGDNTQMITVPTGGGTNEPWEGKLHIAWGDGNPSIDETLFGFQNTVLSVAQPTPTNIGVSVGRLVRFVFKTNIIVATIRYFGISTVAAGAYSMAIYNASTSAKVWGTNTIGTIANSWSANVSGLPVTLNSNTPYWFGIGARTTGTTPGFRTPAFPIPSSITLATMPGSLSAFGNRFAQVVLTTGNWPVTLPALANAAWGANGTLPLIFLDSAS